MNLLITDPCYLEGNPEWTETYLGNFVEADTLSFNPTDVSTDNPKAGHVSMLIQVKGTARFGVDSGQFIIIPEEALGYWKGTEYEDEGGHYRKACEITLGAGAGWMEVGPYWAYVSTTAHGDGCYESNEPWLEVDTDPTEEECDECDGTGDVEETCGDCDGLGYVHDEDEPEVEITCGSCDGDGEVIDSCMYC